MKMRAEFTKRMSDGEQIDKELQATRQVTKEFLQAYKQKTEEFARKVSSFKNRLLL